MDSQEIEITFRINRIESNEFWTNPFSENLTPPYGWSRIKRIKFELIFFKFFEKCLPCWINWITNFRIESNDFRTNSNLTPPLNSPILLEQWNPAYQTWKTKSNCIGIMNENSSLKKRNLFWLHFSLCKVLVYLNFDCIVENFSLKVFLD